MKFFEVKRTIPASPEAVWRVLTDARRLERGGFGIIRIDGEIKPDSSFKLWSEVNPKRAFPLRGAAFVPGRRMVWSGGLPLGLFRGVRQFNLKPVADGTAFEMREEYSGVLLPLIWPSLPDLNPSFEKFADGLSAALAGEAA